MKSHRLVENIQGSSTTDSTLIQSRVLHSPLSCRQIPRSILDPAPERRRGGRSREREAGKTLGKKAQPHTAVQPGSGSDHGMCPPEPLHIVVDCFLFFMMFLTFTSGNTEQPWWKTPTFFFIQFPASNLENVPDRSFQPNPAEGH